jgi:protein-tyrosine-phosphatase
VLTDEVTNCAFGGDDRKTLYITGGGTLYSIRTTTPGVMLVTSPAPKRVVFVCVENSNRSQMAEAFARIHGGDKIEAHSAGSWPSGRINPKAVEAMAELGYDLTTHTSKSIDQFNGQQVDVAVTMGCGDECPLVKATRREEWEIPDPKELPPDQFRAVRDMIEAKVKQLLASL